MSVSPMIAVYPQRIHAEIYIKLNNKSNYLPFRYYNY